MLSPDELHKEWRDVLLPEFSKPYFEELSRFVESAYSQNTVFPPRENIFNAFNETPLSAVKVVILGQDPYHGLHQANGLSFSVNEGVKQPRSLVNIFKEIAQCGIVSEIKNGDLTPWARQGVFLLNTTLTVNAGKPGSHQRKGWEIFTDAVIKGLAANKKGVVYFLWGSHAQKKDELIPSKSNLILHSAHPSPLSAYRGFFGCNHFLKANDYLEANGLKPICW